MDLIAIVLVLILGAFLSGIFFKIRKPIFHGILSVISSFLAFILVIKTFWTYSTKGEFFNKISFFTIGNYSFDLIFKADPINLFFALFGAYVSVGICLYSVKYMVHEKEGFGRFYFFIQLFIASYLGLTLSENLIWSYVFFELTGLCSYQLIAFWYSSDISSYSARKAFLMTHVAGYGFLLAVIMMYSNPENFWIYQDFILAFLLIAVVAKSVQWPLFTWIPYAMNAPTPVSALLHAACLVKCGVYLLIKFYFLLGGYPLFWQNVLTYLGIGSSLIGVLFALKQDDIKKLLAYHTVSQIGYMVSGIGIGTSLGIAAGIFHALNHALFKGLLFLVAGILQQATLTRSLSLMGGLSSKLPLTTFLYIVGAASISGIPGFNGFVSKWMFYQASLQAGHPFVSILGLFVSTLTLISFLKVFSTAFLGTSVKPYQTIKEKHYRSLILGAFSLAIPCIVLGIYPQLAINFLVNPLICFLGLPPVSFKLDQFPITLIGLIALTFILLLSMGYFLLRHKSLIKESYLFTGGKEEAIVNPSSEDVIFEIKTQLKTFYEKGDPDHWLVKGYNLIENFLKRLYLRIVCFEEKAFIKGFLGGTFLLLFIFLYKLRGLD